MKKEEIGRIIQTRREKLSLKQEDVAELAGLTTKTLYLIEKGKGNPSLDILQRLLTVLGLEIDVAIKKLRYEREGL